MITLQVFVITSVHPEVKEMWITDVHGPLSPSLNSESLTLHWLVGRWGCTATVCGEQQVIRAKLMFSGNLQVGQPLFDAVGS